MMLKYKTRYSEGLSIEEFQCVTVNTPQIELLQ